MIDSLLSGTSIPALEQFVNFAQSRHAVLASNVANADVPGYKARDLSFEAFQTSLREALQAGSEQASLQDYGLSAAVSRDPMREVRASSESIVYHDETNVGLEQQVAEITQNQLRHNLALTIMTDQFRLLQTAISERV